MLPWPREKKEEWQRMALDSPVFLARMMYRCPLAAMTQTVLRLALAASKAIMVDTQTHESRVTAPADLACRDL